VVTPIGPLLAPLGTVVLICVSEVTVNEAAVPLNATAVAPVKCEPLIVTVVPTGPLLGVKELMVGDGPGTVTVKAVELVALPAGVVTVIGPLLAPLGTVALICVSDTMVKEAGVPLNATAVAPVMCSPLIVTVVPTGPLLGVKELMVGGGPGTVTVKAVELVALPAGVVTVIGPLLAPLGTVALISVSETTVKTAGVPLKATAVAPVKCAPLIVTVVPIGPPLGVKKLILGGSAQTRNVFQASLNEAPTSCAAPHHPRPCPGGPQAPIPGLLGSRG
jgi:hypothetical protein